MRVCPLVAAKRRTPRGTGEEGKAKNFLMREIHKLNIFCLYKYGDPARATLSETVGREVRACFSSRQKDVRHGLNYGLHRSNRLGCRAAHAIAPCSTLHKQQR